mgnify:CR=1 FL=1
MAAPYEQDVARLAKDKAIPWQSFEGKTMCVTGATGLIGGLIVRALCAHAELVGSPLHVVLPVRNLVKAQKRFGGMDGVHIVEWDALSSEAPQGLDSCDYIIHCASNTDSRLMVERPVDTVLATVEGTRSMLELARSTSARICFVSSMEVYGSGSQEPLDERCGGELDAMSVRSSYPQAKQLAETLCASYASQYGLSACVARLAQSFGPGIAPSDRRVFAEFARCCREGRDIGLLTDGSKSNMYVYTADAVAALLLLVVKGEAGRAYNIANEQTFCSIWEMAQMVAGAFGPHTKVTRVMDEEAAKRYAVSGKLWLDTTRIRSLGWEPTADLVGMYERMMADWDDTKDCG